MQSTLPVNRRARIWYGQRSAPTEPLHHADPAAAPEPARIPAVRVAQIGLQIRKTPVYRRLTALL